MLHEQRGIATSGPRNNQVPIQLPAVMMDEENFPSIIARINDGTARVARSRCDVFEWQPRQNYVANRIGFSEMVCWLPGILRLMRPSFSAWPKRTKHKSQLVTILG